MRKYFAKINGFKQGRLDLTAQAQQVRLFLTKNRSGGITSQRRTSTINPELDFRWLRIIADN